MINSVSVETPQRYKTFNLIHGDITRVDTDLLVISTHGNPTLRPTGQVIDCLKSQYGTVIDPDCRWLDFAPDRWTCFQRQPEPATFSAILTVRIPSLLRQQDPLPFFDQAVQGVFASVAALEHMGEAFRVISLPVLYGQRIVEEHEDGADQYPKVAEILVRHALRWLKRSEQTHTVQFVVFQEQEVALWSAAVDTCLGRSLISSGTDAVLTSLRQEILALTKQQNDARLVDAAERLARDLAHPDRLIIENICVSGRILVEAMVKAIREEVPPRSDKGLEGNIDVISKSGRFAPWITSYMHSLRIFGNDNAHFKGADLEYRPLHMDKGDLVSALSAARALLTSWPEMLKCGKS